MFPIIRRPGFIIIIIIIIIITPSFSPFIVVVVRFVKLWWDGPLT